jgi:Icc protein
MIIAQISDTHIKPEGQLAYRRVYTAAYLEGAVQNLLALQPRPDLVLGTGDLVDAGLP